MMYPHFPAEETVDLVTCPRPQTFEQALIGAQIYI